MILDASPVRRLPTQRPTGLGIARAQVEGFWARRDGGRRPDYRRIGRAEQAGGPPGLLPERFRSTASRPAAELRRKSFQATEIAKYCVATFMSAELPARLATSPGPVLS